MTTLEAGMAVGIVAIVTLFLLFGLRWLMDQGRTSEYLKRMHDQAIAAWQAYDPIEDDIVTQPLPRRSRQDRKPSARET